MTRLVKQGTRQNAVYIRPIQQIQQLDSLLNSPNSDGDSDQGHDSTKLKNTFSVVEPSKNSHFATPEKTPLRESVELEAVTQLPQAVEQFNKQFNSPVNVEFAAGDSVVIANITALMAKHPSYPVRRSNDIYKIKAIKADKAHVESTVNSKFDRWLPIAGYRSLVTDRWLPIAGYRSHGWQKSAQILPKNAICQSLKPHNS